tara:strand:+ start:41 stop:511 length:471 start_codon:yes stop_codon:yes gene_type:complete
MQELIEDALTYDPDTGLFKWLNPQRSSTAKEGWFSGYLSPLGYRFIRLNGKIYRAHRLAWYLMKGHWPKLFIDHIDNVRDNNKLENLRDVSRQVNALNSNKTSGACKTKYNKWAARVQSDRTEYLGFYDTREEAELVAKKRREELIALLIKDESNT